MNPSYRKIISLTIYLALIFFGFACSGRINLSRKEISGLHVVYRQIFNHKFFESEWIFYEKQLCQMKTKFISTKSFTGTWTEKNDTITAWFFNNKKVTSEWNFVVNKANGELTGLRK